MVSHNFKLFSPVIFGKFLNKTFTLQEKIFFNILFSELTFLDLSATLIYSILYSAIILREVFFEPLS